MNTQIQQLIDEYLDAAQGLEDIHQKCDRTIAECLGNLRSGTEPDPEAVQVLVQSLLLDREAASSKASVYRRCASDLVRLTSSADWNDPESALDLASVDFAELAPEDFQYPDAELTPEDFQYPDEVLVAVGYRNGVFSAQTTQRYRAFRTHPAQIPSLDELVIAAQDHLGQRVVYMGLSATPGYFALALENGFYVEGCSPCQ